MHESLLVLQAAVPVYLVVLLGVVLRRTGVLRPEMDKGLMTIAAVKAKPPTVGDLVSELSKYDKDATVVIRSEYGDRNEAFLASEYVGLDDPDDFHWSWLNTDDGEQDYVAIYSQGWNYDKL